MAKIEGDFTAKLLKEFRKKIPHAIVFKIADRITYGIPDTVVTFDGYTSWWEMKVIRDKDGFNLKGLGKGIQWNNCLKLSKEGTCFYIVFVDRTNDKRILLVHPQDVNIENPIGEVEGHDYAEMAEHMILSHTPKKGII